jgi:ferredoxin
MRPKFFIVFISPNGSTRLVADLFLEQLTQAGGDVTFLNLSDQSLIPDCIEKISEADDVCLLIGSPVYRDMAVPPVMNFIADLPELKNAWTVPFVTWGHACSGIALWQIGQALEAKGFRIAGAAKVGAVHSMMRNMDHPIGEGHPDGDEQEMIVNLIKTLISRFDAADMKALDLSVLDYQNSEMSVACKERLGKPWVIVPKKIDTNACTQCGLCVDECPVESIRLNPYPEYLSSCFDCFNCVLTCPEDAIRPGKPIEEIAVSIKKRVSTIQEQPLTQVFTG